MRGLIAAAVLALSVVWVPATVAEDATNYCDEPTSNQEWMAKIIEHQDSDIWQRLFALRMGLCISVEKDLLSLDRATLIFERARARAIDDMGKKKERTERDLPQSGEF